MKRAAYRLTGPATAGATLGLIVLQVDETLETEFRHLCQGQDIALHVTRIPSGADLTPDTIVEMEADLPAAAALLPPGAAFDSVAYACTSGSTLIGAGRVADLVGGAVRTRAVTDPATAARAGLAALGVRSIAIVSPYIEPVAEPVARGFADAGFAVADMITFGEEVEARVARIDPASVADAARAVGAAPEVDAVFLSCTNLRTLDLIAPLEAELGKPVLSSNLALAWHMFGQAGLAAPGHAAGRARLFAVRAG